MESTHGLAGFVSERSDQSESSMAGTSDSASSGPADTPPDELCCETEEWVATGTCVHCSCLVENKTSYACWPCKLWPICPKCTLEYHLNHVKVTKPASEFEKWLANLKAWWSKWGTREYQAVLSLHQRAQSAMAAFECLSCHPIYAEDDIFQRVLKRRYDPVREKAPLFREAVDLVAPIIRVRDVKNLFCSSLCPLTGVALKDLIFSADAARDVEKIVILLDAVSSSHSVDPFAHAVAELELLNRTLEMGLQFQQGSSPPTRRCPLPAAGSATNQHAKLSRSKSLHSVPASAKKCEYDVPGMQ